MFSLEGMGTEFLPAMAPQGEAVWGAGVCAFLNWMDYAEKWI